MLNFILFAVVLFVSLFIGVFGFCQIIGTIRTFGSRPIALELSTIIIWIIILFGIGFAVTKWLNDYTLAYYIAMGISLILSWKTGINGVE